jgi:hypothetical protein
MIKPIIFSVIIFSSVLAKGQNGKQLFTFEPDLRIFTVYAFYNAAGYNRDWLEMHPIRIETRKYIGSVLDESFKEKIRDFSNKIDLDWGTCAFYALNLDSAPSFNWSSDTSNLDLKNRCKGFDNLLREFFKKANIQLLWDKYKKAFDSINYSYEPYSQKALNDIIIFTKIDKDFYTNYSGNIHFMICPLMSHWTACNYTVNNTLFLIQGPTDGKPGPYAFYHEALHPPLGPIIEKYKVFANNYQKLNDCAQEKLKGQYNNIISLLNECFVRTIDKYLSGQFRGLTEKKIRIMVEDEYKLGFIFCPYIYENIPQYLNSKKSLSDYYPILMANLDVAKEVERWRNYQKNDK